MRIAIIGSSQYKDMIAGHAVRLIVQGHEVKAPAFDDFEGLDELGVCEYNRSIIEWAEEVHIFWDQRSMGTIFDFGMAFALRKPVKVVYLEKKTFAGVMKKYEELREASKSQGVNKCHG